MGRWLRWSGGAVLPRRASTGAWMILTFALFVGLAVTVVGFAVASVLQGEMRKAAREVLFDRARVAVGLATAAETPEERAAVVRRLNESAPFRLVLWDGARVYGREAAPAAPAAPPAAGWEALRLDGQPTGFETAPAPRRRGYTAAWLRRAGAPGAAWISQPAERQRRLVTVVDAALALGMFFILGISIIGAWVAARQVVKPLDAIRATARNISEGRFEERIRVDSRAAEFQDLARRLNHMASGLHDKIQELQRLTQLQSEFIGNVSHEVRNPIFAVGGYLEALSTSNLRDDQRKRYAEKGLMNLQRLNNLFNDLIEIARLEYREDLIQTRVFDLQELIEEITDTLRPKADEKNLRLETDNDPVMVAADRNRIRQVLVNLIDNAVAYTDEGAVRCRLSRRLDKVRIEVIDTGKGVPEDHLERIFERFHRVDPDRSRKSGGTGLGLSIVKQILHAHGEPIHVESTVGRGSRFWFELPFAEEAPPEG